MCSLKINPITLINKPQIREIKAKNTRLIWNLQTKYCDAGFCCSRTINSHRIFSSNDDNVYASRWRVSTPNEYSGAIKVKPP